MANTDHLFFGNDFDINSDQPINFLETRLTDLSPFSAHEIIVDEVTYKTVEHAYQALRIKEGPEREEIRNTGSPMDAWRAGQKYKNVASLGMEDFDKDVLMEKLFRAKLARYEDIKAVLIATRDRELLKVYDTDYYWGTGKDGSGENKMGKVWMKLREELNSKI